MKGFTQNNTTEYVNIGGEYINSLGRFGEIALRGGYNSAFQEDSQQGLTLGGGLNIYVNPNFSVGMDYAYAEWDFFGDIHRYSVNFQFSNMTVIKALCYCLLIALLCWSCEDSSTTEPETEEVVIATVGDKKITLKQFRERSELTPRPGYCSGNSLDAKGIVLNSLIGEKLLALEAEKEEKLVNNSSFRNYVRGIKEQSMRLHLLEEELADDLKLSDEEWTRYYNQAIRKMEVAFLHSNSLDEINAWRAAIDASGDFDQVAMDIRNGKPAPIEEVGWGESLEALDDAIFDKSVDAGSVVGPIKTPVGYYIARVNKATREMPIGQGSQDEQLRKVESVITGRKWLKAASQYVADLMSDRDIQLDAKGFDLLLSFYKPTHAIPNTKAEYLQFSSGELEMIREEAEKALVNNLDTPLLTVNGKPWTIGEFIEYSKRRPVTFRSKKMYEREFPHHLKLAIQDMLRDQRLTEAAYEKGLDKKAEVLAEAETWRDHLLAIGKRNLLLKQLGFDEKISRNPLDAINVLRPQLNVMARFHPIEVLIDEQTLSEITLNRVQMKVVRNHDFIYREAVPNFPIITNDERLTYFPDAHRWDKQ